LIPVGCHLFGDVCKTCSYVCDNGDRFMLVVDLSTHDVVIDEDDDGYSLIRLVRRRTS
jgi:hypothetical protein